MNRDFLFKKTNKNKIIQADQAVNYLEPTPVVS